jgi:hypothetical protein
LGSGATVARFAAAVWSEPQIIQQPTNVIALAGQTVTFATVATGAPVLHYQWRMNGRVLPGETNPRLTLTNVGLSQAGVYPESRDA